MPDASPLILFVAAGWLLNLTPGPDVLYIVTNSLRNGWRAGLVAGLGITAGCFVHVFGAGLGVGALLATSATAFTVVKSVGALYLMWIGVRALVSKSPEQPADLTALAGQVPGETLRKIFYGGFWTNALNPKVAIFFLTFLPQFIDPQASNKTAAFLALGVLFNVNSIPVNAAWAMASAWTARHQAVQRGMHWLDRLAGVMFIGFGVRLVLARQNP